jgi:hypothetical protein
MKSELERCDVCKQYVEGCWIEEEVAGRDTLVVCPVCWRKHVEELTVQEFLVL